MSSTAPIHPTLQAHRERRPASRLSTVLIASATLALGYALGSSEPLDRTSNPSATAKNAPIAAPAGARIYEDWRGNSAGKTRPPIW